MSRGKHRRLLCVRLGQFPLRAARMSLNAAMGLDGQADIRAGETHAARISALHPESGALIFVRSTLLFRGGEAKLDEKRRARSVSPGRPHRAVSKSWEAFA